MLIKTQLGLLVPTENMKFMKIEGSKIIAVLALFYKQESEYNSSGTEFYELELGSYRNRDRAREVFDEIYFKVGYPVTVYNMPVR